MADVADDHLAVVQTDADLDRLLVLASPPDRRRRMPPITTSRLVGSLCTGRANMCGKYHRLSETVVVHVRHAPSSGIVIFPLPNPRILVTSGSEAMCTFTGGQHETVQSSSGFWIPIRADRLGNLS
jgi:hypothetical protein